MKPKFSTMVVSLVFVTLTACSTVPSVNSIPENIANASTSADHQRIADYFTQKASSYENEAAWHEKMALAYASRPKGDLSAMMAHCRSLRDQFANAAKEARELAETHRQLGR